MGGYTADSTSKIFMQRISSKHHMFNFTDHLAAESDAGSHRTNPANKKWRPVRFFAKVSLWSRKDVSKGYTDSIPFLAVPQSHVPNSDYRGFVACGPQVS